MTLALVSPAALGSLDAARVLGGFDIGQPDRPIAGSWPMLPVHTPLLDGGVRELEAWVSDDAIDGGEHDGIVWRRTAGLLWGVLTLVEDNTLGPGGLPALRQMGEQAYTRIFHLIDAAGMPHLWRAWNYIPDIHGEQAGLERYRLFNMGRGDAFERCARSVTEQVPAACALGVSSGPLAIAFLAGLAPVQPIENPRQVSAYRYPADYGPRSPTFSRAALAQLGRQELLFMSGTASIVGHASLHPGDVVAQTRESLDNVAAVLAEAARLSRSGGFSLGGLQYRAYLRHAEDLEAVQGVIAARVGAARVACVQAEICRRELLVEIEALGVNAF